MSGEADAVIHFLKRQGASSVALTSPRSLLATAADSGPKPATALLTWLPGAGPCAPPNKARRPRHATRMRSTVAAFHKTWQAIVIRTCDAVNPEVSFKGFLDKSASCSQESDAFVLTLSCQVERR